MKKRLMCVLLTLGMLGACLAGCGGSGGEVQGDGAEGGQTEGAGDVEVVTYYCGVGAYLQTLQQEVDTWNAGEGKEKGVYIQLTSDIDNYGVNLKAMMQAGNFPDIYDYAYEHQDFTANGWNVDLRDIPGLEDTIARFEPYMQDGVNYHDGKLICLPLEVIPVKFAVNTDLFEKNNLELPETWDDVVECARVITENGDGVDYGYGFTYQWSAGFRRLAMKASYSSLGKGWWDNNNAVYDFSVYEPVMEAYAQMYQNGYMFPDPAELSIDGIRSKFAEGHVGMIVAYGYDIGVYNEQFPAQCNWKVIDCPTYEEGEAPYKGVYLNRGGVGVTCGVTEERMPAVAEAVKFLYSEELYKKLYATGGIIPHDPSIAETTEMEREVTNWAEMCDLTNYAAINLFPDNLLAVEGDNSEVTFQTIMVGDGKFEELIPDLNERYNAAYQALKESGDIDLSVYEQPYDLKK